MPSVHWVNDPALVSTNPVEKQQQQNQQQQLQQHQHQRTQQQQPDAPILEDSLNQPQEEAFGGRLGRNFDSFMTYVCFPEETMDYICFPEEHACRTAVEGDAAVDKTAVAGIVEKKSQEEKLGISIQKHLKREGIYIYKINATSKFADTDLAPGMKILSINDEPCPPTVPEAIAVLKLAKDTVKILAEPADGMNDILVDDAPREGAPGEDRALAVAGSNNSNTVSFTDYLTSTYAQYEEAITNMSVNNVLEAMTGLEAFSEEIISIEKESPEEKLGVALMQSKTSNKIYVNHVWEGSKFAAAGLKAGHQVLKINGANCPVSLQATVNLMNKCNQLNLTVIVDDHFCYELDETLLWNGKPMANKVTVKMEKSRDEPIGMLLRKYDDKEGIFVRKIAEDGKASKTSLKPHMKILLINGQRCPQDMDDCTQLISQIKGELKIVAVSNIPEELMRQAADA